MTRTDDLERRYAGYGRSARKRAAWDAANPGNAAMRGEVLARLLSAAGDRVREGKVLDIGCGGGWWLDQLRAAGAAEERLHGAELIPERVQAAAARLPGADIREADALALPWADASFDLVLAMTVLSSLESRDAIRVALREARRVLAPGGLLAVWDVRVPNPANRATVRPRRADYRAALGPDATIEAVTPLPALARRLGRATDRLYPALARIRPLTTHSFVTFVQPASGG